VAIAAAQSLFSFMDQLAERDAGTKELARQRAINSAG
jgi:hypothetical protein